jgi:hypothetical protein
LPDDCPETIRSISFLGCANYSWNVDFCEVIFICALDFSFVILFNSLDMFFNAQGWKNLRCVIVKELMDGRKLASDSLDALLSYETSQECAKRIKYSLRLE